MLMYGTDLAMSELADFLARELKQSSYRDLEIKTKVSRGALENIIGQQNTEFPKLETLEKLAEYYKLPLWRVIEMAGITLGLPVEADNAAKQLTSLADRMPQLRPVVAHLLKLHPSDVRGVIAYLETLDRLRDEAEGE
jgi:transcriptional regulator with XRE-family HTH domain